MVAEQGQTIIPVHDNVARVGEVGRLQQEELSVVVHVVEVEVFLVVVVHVVVVAKKQLMGHTITCQWEWEDVLLKANVHIVVQRKMVMVDNQVHVQGIKKKVVALLVVVMEVFLVVVAHVVVMER